MVSIWLQSLVIIANIIGFIYNIPQLYLTIKTKSAKDISGIFLLLRFISAILWIVYCIFVFNIDVLISWCLTGLCSSILLYYKYVYSTIAITPENVVQTMDSVV